jgi:hypothetical protein
MRRNLSPCRGGGPRALRLRRVEAVPGADALRLTFEVRDAAGREFFAYARALPDGALLDIQASDEDRAGTTGRPLVDELIAERVRGRLAHARAGAAIREFDRQS